jgi:hypothetical protein
MQEDAILTYRASNMALAIHSNASYLSKPKSHSRMGKHMFMARKGDIPFNNGTVLNISQIIQVVMSSAAEAELGALFINAKIAILMRQTLVEFGHLKPCTPMQHQYKLTTQQHMRYSPTKYCQKHSRPWIYVSTG